MVAKKVSFLFLVCSAAVGVCACSALFTSSDSGDTAQYTATLDPTFHVTATPHTTAISHITQDACDLLEEKSFAILEETYAIMPPPPHGAELISQIRYGKCQNENFSIGVVYGINGTDGYTVQKYYWDLLADRGWIVYHHMATDPRPLFCHPDYEPTVDVKLLYDPPAEAKEGYETFFGIYLTHRFSESTWECSAAPGVSQ